MVQLEDSDRQAIIADAVSHHIGGQFVEDSDRHTAELKKKEMLRPFLD